MKKARTVLLTAGVLLPGTALAWPDDTQWVALQHGGADVYDPSGDHDRAGDNADGSVDLVGQSPEGAAAYWYADDAALYLRMRVDESPWLIEDATLVPSSWAWLVDIDGDLTNYEYQLGLTGLGATVAVYRNTDGGPGADARAEDYIDSWSTSYVDGLARVVDAGTNINTRTDYFIDLAFDRDVLGSSFEATFGVIAASEQNAGLGVVDNDLAGTDDSATLGAIADAASDPIGIDQDGDGLSDPEEEELGTDPTDADSDDDGLPDEAEIDGGSDPGRCDSDADGLSDGLEAGVVTPGVGTDPAAGCFVADADPGTTTDPIDADTDGGTLADGDEDRDGNGRIDAWETDPNDPADDVDEDTDGIPDALEDDCDEGGPPDDRDADGIPDAVEGLEDTDGDGSPDFCDPDDDDDGIPTVEEGGGDSDGDGIPDNEDPDSDDDGVPDIDEGSGDVDCDGIPDFQDADPFDGPCSDEDQDGLTFEEEQECGSNPANADSDGDGVADPDEGCGDADCDGLPDRIDAEHDPDRCDALPDDTGEGACNPGDPYLDCGHFTGGACSVIDPVAAFLPGLLALLGVMRRRTTRYGAPLLLGSLGLLPTARAADSSLNAQRFRPSPDGRAFIGVEDSTLPDDGFGGSFLFNYAKDPLVYRLDDGSGETRLSGSVGTFDVTALYTFRPVRVAVTMPFHLADGSDVVTGGVRAGDLRLDAKATILDRGDGGPGLAADVDLSLPTGAQDKWLGDVGAGFGGRVIASYGRTLVASANLGVRATPGVELLPDLRWGNRLTWGIGGSLPITEGLRAIAEIDGEQALGTDAPIGTTPIEWRVGAHYLPMRSLVVTAAGGAGVTRGIGAPDLRLIAGVAWVPAPKRASAPGGADRDGDGIGDAVDLCPDQPEDRNGRNDADGCPDAGLTPTRLEIKDPVGARIAGANLEIVSGPESGKYVLGSGEVTRSLRPGTYMVRVWAEGYEPFAGELRVPDADRHEHSFTLKPALVGSPVEVSAADEQGRPLSALVTVIGSPGRKFITGPDGVGTENLPPGSVELSIWSEGYQPERVRIEVRRGATAKVSVVLKESRVKLTSERVEIRDKIFFEFDSAVIKSESFRILDDVTAVLVNHPEITLLEIQGHTDDQGADAYNLGLSDTRANAVRDYMIRSGVEPVRLQARGYGETDPLQPGASVEAREANRRVVFAIRRSAPIAVPPEPPKGRRR